MIDAVFVYAGSPRDITLSFSDNPNSALKALNFCVGSTSFSLAGSNAQVTRWDTTESWSDGDRISLSIRASCAPPTMKFDRDNYLGSEGKSTSIDVVLSPALTVATTVEIQVVNTGGATEGAAADFTLSAKTLSFAAGETRKSFTLSPRADMKSEGNESVDFRLVAPAEAPYTLGVPAVTQIVILDTSKDPADATLSGLTATSSTSESGTYQALDIGAFAASTENYAASVPNDVTHVKLTPTVADSAATVKVGKAGSLATVTNAMASTAIALAVGDNAIKVEVTATDAGTKTYTVTVTRAAPPRMAEITVTPTTLTIPAGEEKTYTLSMDTAPTGNVKVIFSPANSQTYDVLLTVGTGEHTFTPSNWETAHTITVRGLAAGTDSVTNEVASSTATEYPTSLSIDSVSVTVTPSNKTYKITPAVTAEEGADAVLTVTLGEAAPAGNLRFGVEYDYSVSAATTGDTAATPATVTVSAGSNTATLTIAIAPDADSDPNETFTAKIAPPSDLGWNVASDGTDTATVTITDTTPGVPSAIALAEGASSPGNDATPTFTVTVGEAGGAVTLYSDNGCTAAISSPTTVTDTQSPFEVAVTATTLTPDGAYTVRAKHANNGSVSACSTVSASYTLDTTDPVLGAVTDASAKTAVSGTRYLKAGDVATLSVSITDVHPLAPTATLRFGSATADRAALTTLTSSPFLHTYTVVNGDTGKLKYRITDIADSAGNSATGQTTFTEIATVVADTTAPAVAATATASTATATVTDTNARTGGVRYAFSSDATCDSDDIADNSAGTAYSGAVTLSSSHDEKYFCVRAEDLAGNAAYGASAQIGIPKPPTTVTLSTDAAGNAAAEDAGTVTVTATLDQPAGDGGVAVTLAPGSTSTAVAADYTLPATFTVEEGERSATGDVTIVDDDVDEDNETLALTTTVSGLTVTGVTLTITDNDAAGVRVSPGTLSVAEGDTNTYTVVLDSEPTANVTVTPTGSDTAKATFAPASRTFTASNWDMEQTFTVTGVTAGTSMISHAATSTDAKYPSGLSIGTVTVTVTDTTGPAAPTFSPENGDTVTDAGTNITLTFGEAIKADTSATDFTDSTIDNILTLKVTNSSGTAIGFDATIDSAKKVVTINPTANLADGAVYVAVSNGYYDASGNQGTAANATFTVDATGPAAPAFNPVDGATTTDAGTNITLTFAEAVKRTSTGGDFTSHAQLAAVLTLKAGSSSGTAIGYAATINGAKTVITVNPNANLAEGAIYVAVSNAYYDANGNQGAAANATFTVTVTSTDATLSALTAARATSADGTYSALTLDPSTFAPGTETYAASVPNDVTHVKLTPTVNDSGASVKVGKAGSLATVTSGEASTAIALDVGDNALKVEVTAEDASTRTYTVTVTRTARPTTVTPSVSPGTTVAEDVGTVTITVTLDHPALTGGTTLAMEASTSTATPGAGNDFTPETASITIPAGDTTGTFTFTINDDNVAEPDEVITVDLLASNPHFIPGPFDITITDNDDAAVTVSKSSLSVAAGSTGTYTVVLTSEPTDDVIVTPTSGTPAAATVTGALTFTSSDWNMAQTVTVTGVAEGSSTVTHAVTGDDATYSALNPASVAVTVTAAAAAKTYKITPTVTAEEGADAELTVTLGEAAPTGNLQFDVTYNYGGSAATGADTGMTPSTVTVSAGSKTATLTIPLARDRVIDDGETFTAAIAPSTATDWTVASDGVAASTVTITDTTIGVSLGQAAYTVGEGAGSLSVPIEFSSATLEDVRVDRYVNAFGGNATVDDDFTGIGGFQTVPKGTTTFPVSITIVDDFIDEDNETLKILIALAQDGYDAVSPTSATITITDNDTVGVTVAGSPLSVTAGETATYTVVLDTQPTGAVTVTPTSGTPAKATVSGPLTFTTSDWSSPKDVTVTGVAEGSSSVTHAVTGADAKYRALTPDPVAVTVTAAPPPTETYSITAATTADEGSPASLTIRLGKNAPVGGVVFSVVPTYSTTGTGNAVVGDVGSVTSPVTVPANNDSLTISIPTAEDQVDEDNETFKVVIASTTTGWTKAGDGKDTATVTITDDDTAGVTVAGSPLSVAAGETATYTVVLDTQPTASVIVTPTSGTPAKATVSGAVTFTTSDWSSPKDVTVTGVEAGTSSVTHAVTGADAKYRALTPDPVAVTVPAPPSTKTFSIAGATAKEGQNASLAIALGENAPAGGLAFAVALNYTSGTGKAAAADVDSSAPAAVSVSAGAQTATLLIPLARDADAIETSDRETFTVTVTTEAAGWAEASAGAGTATVTIEEATPAVAFASATYHLTEGTDAAVTVAITTTGGINSGGHESAFLAQGITVPVTVTAGGAGAADFTPPAGLDELFFHDTNDGGSFHITIVNDDLVEDDETFTVNFGTMTESTTGSVAETTVTIADDDRASARIAFGDSAASVAEYTDSVAENVAGGMLNVPVTVSHLPGADTAFAVEVLNSSTADSGDYSIGTQTVMFGPTGAKTKNVAIAITDDSAVESAEAIKLRIVAADPTPDDLGDYYTRHASGALATITLNSEDAAVTPGVTVSKSSLSVAAGSTGTYTVKLDTQPSANVVVTPASGTPAKATVTGALTFTDSNWDTPKTVTVTGVDAGSSTITHAASGTDSNYGSTLNIASVAVTVTAAGTQSTDATLSGLVLLDDDDEVLSFTETFSRTKTTYTANVSATVDSMTVTPTVNQADASVKVNTVSVTSGSASGEIELSFGANTITVEVTAESGATQDYTLTVNRALPVVKFPSSDISGVESNPLAFQVRLIAEADNDMVGTLTYTAGTASLVHDLSSARSTGFTMAVGDTRPSTIQALPFRDTLNEEDETFTITIEPGSGYTVGSPATVTVTIEDDDPPAAPAGLAVTARDGALGASWTRPAGPVTGYKLRYKETSAADQDATGAGTDPSTGWVAQAHSGTGTAANVTGLTNGTGYDVQVSATDGQTGTGNGYGDWSGTQAGTPAAATLAVPGTLSVTLGAHPTTGSPMLYAAAANPDDNFYLGVVYQLKEASASWPARANVASRPSGVTVADPENPILENGADESILTGSSYIGFTGLTPGAAYDVRAHLAETNMLVIEASTTPVSATVWTVPGKPAGVAAIAGDAQLDLTWTAPGATGGTGAIIRGYKVRWRTAAVGQTAAGSWNAAGGVDASSASAHTISSLTNDTLYDVQIAADNGIALTAASWSAAAQGTPAAGQLAAPSTQIAAGDQSLTLTWTAPSWTVSTVAVRWRVKDTDPNMAGNQAGAWIPTFSGVGPASAAQITARSMPIPPWACSGCTVPDNGKTYEVFATFSRADAEGGGDTGWVSAGEGAPQGAAQSADATLSALTAESAESASGTYSALALDPETFAPGTGSYTATVARAVTHVKLTPTVTHSAATVKVGKAGNLATVTSAMASTAIALDVGDNAIQVVVTAEDTSTTKTYTVTVTRAADKPGAPTGLTIAPGDKRLTVSFTAPGDDGGAAITDYSVQWRVEGTSSWSTQLYAGAATTLTIPAGPHAPLVNGTTYEVQITARNSAGFGPSSAIATGTPEGAPGAPTALEVTAGDASLTLRWAAPVNDGGSALTGYDVQFKVSTVTNWADAAHSGTGTAALITILTNGTNYDVRVRAVNANGNSDWVTGSGTPMEGASDDATLSALTATSSTSEAGTYQSLDIGAFAAATETYTATVPNATTHVKLTPTVNDSGAAVKVGKAGSLATVTSGEASTAIALGLGENAIQVEVTAEDASTKTYTVTVTRLVTSPGAPQNVAVTAGDGSLSLTWQAPASWGSYSAWGYEIYMKGGILTSWTNTNTLTDTTQTSYSFSSFPHPTTFVDTPLANGTTYTLRMAAVSQDSNDDNVFLEGPNSQEVSATPQEAASTDATLSALTAASSTSAGGTFEALDIGAFAAATETYTASVANDVTHVKLTPTVNDSDASVKVGKAGSLATVTSGEASTAIALDEGANAIKVEVTAEDTSTKTYTVTVTRAGANVISFGATTYTFTEGQTSDTSVGVTRVGDASVLLTVNFDFVDGTATSGSGTCGASDDVRIDGTSLAILEGISTTSMSFVVCNDSVNEPDESFTATIQPGTGYTVGSPATTTITIQDNDAPAAPAGLAVTAKDGALGASWTKPAGPVTGYRLRYKETNAADQDATGAGTDPSTGWVAQAHTGTGTTADVTGLTAGTGYDVQVSATDGDTGYGDWSGTQSGTPLARTYSFSVNQSGGAEGFPANFDVVLSVPAPSGGVTFTLTPDYSAGSASAADVGAGAPASVTVAAGALDVDVDYPLAANDGIEPRETFDLALSTTAAGWTLTLGRTNTIEIGIAEQTGTVAFGASAASTVEYTDSVAEGGGTLSVPVTVDELPGGSATIEVEVVSGGTAALDTDYVIATKSVTFAPTDSGNTQNLSVAITDDSAAEPSETIKLRIKARTAQTGDYAERYNRHAQGGAATLTITDNDQPPGAPTGLTAAASDSRLDLSWSAPTDTGSSAITGYHVRYKTSDALDRVGSGNDPTTGWLDASQSGTGTTVSITSLTNGTTYHVSVRAVNNAGSGPWTSPPVSGTPAVGLSADATLSALTASSSTDGSTFTTSLGIGTFAAGTTSYTASVANTTTHVKLTPTVAESNASVQVGKGTSLNTVTSGSASAAVALDVGDNAVKAVVTAQNGATRTYTVTVTRAAAQAVTAPGVPRNVQVTPGDKSLTLTWEAPASWGTWTAAGYGIDIQGGTFSGWERARTVGDASVTSHRIFGLIGNQAIENGTAYSVRIRALSINSAGDDSRVSSWVTVSATPVASTTVSLSVAPNPVAEGAQATVTATLSAPLTGNVTIPITLTGVTAESGDHGALSSIEIAGGATSGTGTVAAAEDDDTDDETFTVALGTLPNSVVAGAPASVTVTIEDNDKPPLELTADRLTLVEGGGDLATVTVTATLAEPAAMDQSIGISISGPGTADTRIGGGVYFPRGSSTLKITLTTTDDDIAEPNETVTLTIHLVGNEAVTDSITLTIVDDDGDTAPTAPTSLSLAADPAPAEGGPDVTVTATLDHPAPMGGTTVTLVPTGTASPADGSPAGASPDYTLSSTTVEIAEGQTEGTATIKVVDDAVDDDDETIVLNATSTNPVLTAQTLTLAIEDNDDGTGTGTGTRGGGGGPPSVRSSDAGLSALSLSAGTLEPAFATDTTAYTASVSNDVASVTVTATARHAAATVTVNGNAPSTPVGLEVGETVIAVRVTAEDGTGRTYTVTVARAARQPTELTLSAAPAPAEGGPDVTVTATLDAPAPTGGTTVTLSLSGTASPGGDSPDYTLSTTTVEIAGGQTEGTATLTIIDDAVDDDDETIVLDATSTNPALTSNTLTLTIADNDGPPTTLTLSADPAPAEGGPDVTVTATLDAPAPAGGTTVTLSLSGTASPADGSPAGASPDYTLSSTTVEIAGGETEGTATITVIDDAVDDDDETIVLDATSDTPALTSNTLTLTVADNDGPPTTLTLSADPAPAEGESDVTLTATLDAPAPVGGTTVTLSLSGTASPGGDSPDYTLSSTAIEIAGGETEGTATITVIDDAVDDDDETIVLDATSDTPALTSNTLTLTIADNDGPPTTLTLSADPAPAEDGPDVTVTATLDAPAPVGGTTVTLSLSGTASPGGDSPAGASPDYTLSSTTVEIAGGETEGTATIAVIDDAVDDDDETIVLDATSDTPALTSNTLTLTVADNDGPPTTLTLSADPAPAEGGPDVTVTAALDAPAPEGGTTVTLIPTGTATGTGEDADYTLSSMTVEIAEGETEGTATLTIIDDAVDDDDETIVLDATSTNPALTSNTLTLTVADNDGPPTTLTLSADPAPAEGGPDVTVTAALDAPAPVGGTTVTLIPTGTATGTGEDADYTLSSTTIEIAGGQTKGTATITVIDDAMDDDDETIVLDATSDTPVLASNTLTLTLADDDTAGVRVSETELELNEGATGAYTAVLESEPLSDVTVTFSSSDPEAVWVSAADDAAAAETPAPADGPAAHSERGPDGVVGRLTFTPGNWATAQTLTVAALQDDDDADETVVIGHTAVSSDPNYDGLDVAPVTVRVRDDEVAPTALTLSAAPAPAEGGPDVTVTATLDAPAPVGGTTVTLIPTGTATGSPADGSPAGDSPDYTLSSATIEIAGGETEGTATITVIDDAVDDDDETLILNATSTNPALTAEPLTLTIADNDDSPSALTLSANPAPAEGGPDVTVTASLDHPAPVGGTTVTLSLSGTAESAPVDSGSEDGSPVGGGPADGGPDYTLSSATVEIAGGETEATATLTVIDDKVDDDDETIVLDATSTNPALTAEPLALTIADNDDPPSSDASLRSLAVSHGRLDPAFSPDTAGYAVALVSDPGEFTVTAAANDAGARVSMAVATQRTGAEMAINGGTGMIALAEGLTTVELRVTAEDGTQFGYTIRVSLDTAADEAAVLGATLAGQARALLGDVNDVIGGRLEGTVGAPGGASPAQTALQTLIALAGGAGGAGAHQTGAGQTGAGSGLIGGSAIGAPPVFEETASGHGGLAPRQGVEPRQGFAPRQGTRQLFDLLAGRSFSVALSGTDAQQTGAGARQTGTGNPAGSSPSAGRSPAGRSPLSLWGAGSAQRFAGGAANRYDGELRSLYLGVDRAFGTGGLFGAAVSLTEGDTGYAYAGAEGRLETSLTGLYPYLRGASGRFAYWGIGGIGRGDAAWTRAGLGDRYEEDLEMTLAAVGGKLELTSWSAAALSLVADAGQAGLEIDAGAAHASPADGGSAGASPAGASPLAGLSSSVSRARLGLELSRKVAAGDGAWTISGGLRARYDGGDGLAGAGLEATASFGYAAPRLEIEARARWLGMHEADEVDAGDAASVAADPRESGASLRVLYRHASDGTGLRVLLEPGFGDTARAQSFWQSDSLAAMQGRIAGPATMSWRAQLGYGLKRRGLWTPLAQYDRSAFGARRLGLRWDHARAWPEGDLRWQLRLERTATLGTGAAQPDWGLRLQGVVRFGGRRAP